MYAEFLEFAGLRAETAATAEEGIAKAFELTPSVIVMDLALPGMDGWEATRQLKADKRTKDVPIVVVTGHAIPDRLEAARTAGADAVLTKPLLPIALLEHLMPFIRGTDESPPHQATRKRRRRRER